MARFALCDGHTSCRHPFTTRLSPACRPLVAHLSPAGNPFTTLLLPFCYPFTTLSLPFSPHQIDTWL